MTHAQATLVAGPRAERVVATRGRHSLREVAARGLVVGMAVGVVAATVAAATQPLAVQLAYTVDWLIGFGTFGAWVGAMFFGGDEGCCQ